MPIKKLIVFLLLLLIPINVFALNKAPIDITTMDITEISKALDEGILTSEELVNLYLDRINSYNSNYNAIITINNKAIDEAKALDKERSGGKVRSILHGIPIIVKDNIDVYGLPTTAGASALADNYPKANAFVIQKLIDKGAIIFAKANMSEFAFMASSSSSSYGTVKNAYNFDYSAYGSSGGSAVSVAASFASAALGTDTNSSVRVPSAANYVVGLRPTTGLTSTTGVLPYDPERDTVGPITKTVSDSVILLNAISGYDEKYSKSIKSNDTYKITSSSLKGYTLGFPSDFLKGSNDNGLKENKETYSEIYEMMNNAILKMQKNGAQIVYIDNYYTYDEDYLATTTYSAYLFCDYFNKYIENTTGSIRSFEALTNAYGKTVSLNNYVTECGSNSSLNHKNELKTEYKDYITNIMDKYKLNAIVYPTTKNKLLEAGTTGFTNLSAHAASTISFPAISVPLGFDSDNLPYGIEFMAKANEENTIYNITSVYEKLNINITTPGITPNLYKIPGHACGPP